MINLETFLNDDTLNIFTDASMDGNTGCYGAIGVIGGSEIDNHIRVIPLTTNNDAEIKGVRAGVEMAVKYRDSFKNLNVFSDSQLAIYGIRDRICGWKLEHNTLYTKGNTEVSSQEIYIEIVYMILSYSLNINFYHQKSHTTFSGSNLEDAEHVFEASNGIRETVDMRFIKFISKWNNEVDKRTRETLKANRRFLGSGKDGISFIPGDFDRDRYRELTEPFSTPI